MTVNNGLKSHHLATKTPSKEATTTDNEPPTTGHAGKHNTKTQCTTNTTASETANEQTIFADQVSSIYAKLMLHHQMMMRLYLKNMLQSNKITANEQGFVCLWHFVILMQREHNWILTIDLAMRLATLNDQFNLIEICELNYINDNYNLVTDDHPYTITTTATGQAPSMKAAHL